MIDLQAWFGDSEKIVCPDCSGPNAVKLNELEGFCPDCGGALALEPPGPAAA
jgi:hypothetical protein